MKIWWPSNIELIEGEEMSLWSINAKMWKGGLEARCFVEEGKKKGEMPFAGDPSLTTPKPTRSDLRVPSIQPDREPPSEKPAITGKALRSYWPKW